VKGRRSKKGAQSRAANEHPRTRRVSHPVVSFGRSAAAESRGHRWTRESTREHRDLGRRTKRNVNVPGGQNNRRGSARRKKRKRVHRKRLFVSVVRCFRGIGRNRERNLRSTVRLVFLASSGRARGGAARRERREGKSETRRAFSFFTFVVLTISTRAALDPCVVVHAFSRYRCVVSAQPPRKMDQSRGIDCLVCEIKSLTCSLVENSLTLNDFTLSG